MGQKCSMGVFLCADLYMELAAIAAYGPGRGQLKKSFSCPIGNMDVRWAGRICLGGQASEQTAFFRFFMIKLPVLGGGHLMYFFKCPHKILRIFVPQHLADLVYRQAGILQEQIRFLEAYLVQ